VLREMYAERNSSGKYVHFNKHGSKTNLHKCNGLKYDLQLSFNFCSKAFVSLNIKKFGSRGQQNACRLPGELTAGVIRFKYNCYQLRCYSKYKTNIQINYNTFSISPVVM